MELHEKIDQYLLNQMSPSDKAAFEQLIASDSLLKHEVALQQSVVAALGDTRALQLKARMQKIPVSLSSTAQALRLRWMGIAAAGTLTIGLIAYLFTTPSTLPTNDTQNVTVPATQQTEAFNPATTEATETLKASSPAVQEQPKTDTKKKTESQNRTVANSELKAFDADALADQGADQNLSTSEMDQHTVPVNSLYNETNTKLSNLSVTVDNSNLSDKSYQFSGAKLTLFGDFNNKPYELLELNNKGQKTLFLSYDNSYYELVWGQTKKTPLKKVSNKETLEKLKMINR